MTRPPAAPRRRPIRRSSRRSTSSRPRARRPAARSASSQVVKQDQQQAIIVRAEGLPRLPSESSGYGVWLSSSPSKRIWLGYGNDEAEGRTFTATGAVTDDVTSYGEVFVTRQTGEGPERPGTIYLRGAVEAAGGG